MSNCSHRATTVHSWSSDERGHFPVGDHEVCEWCGESLEEAEFDCDYNVTIIPDARVEAVYPIIGTMCFNTGSGTTYCKVPPELLVQVMQKPWAKYTLLVTADSENKILVKAAESKTTTVEERTKYLISKWGDVLAKLEDE